jgi:HD-like signal output (HDOD) protein
MNLHDAVFRIGMNQINTLIIFTHVQGKVLRGGHFQSEVNWISGLSMAMARLARILAADLGMQPDAAFTFGMLMHLEHFIILGVLPEINREHEGRIQPSRSALHEAFRRFGWQVRGLTVRKWELQELLTGDAGQEGIGDRYHQLRSCLIAHWAGEKIHPEIEGISSERLIKALEEIGPQELLQECQE